QAALDDWDTALAPLADVYRRLNDGAVGEAMPFDPMLAHSPLPRAYQWADASAYVNHVELVRKARGATMPAEFWSDPLMYQGASDNMLGAGDDIIAGYDAGGIAV